MTFNGQTTSYYHGGPVAADAPFGPVETITVGDLKAGDFIVSVPPQQGIRGTRVDSGVRDLRPDFGTWTASAGYRRPRLPVESRVIMVNNPRSAGMNYPLSWVVEVRRAS